MGHGAWGIGHGALGIGQQSTVNSQQSKAIHASPIPLIHNTPLELGIIPPRRGSISTAMRMALAKALNVASIM